MPKHRPRRPSVSEDEALANRIDFTRADLRLDLMEEQARAAIRDHARMFRVVKKATPPPFLLPSRWSGVLLGLDGKPLTGEIE